MEISKDTTRVLGYYQLLINEKQSELNKLVSYRNDALKKEQEQYIGKKVKLKGHKGFNTALFDRFGVTSTGDVYVTLKNGSKYFTKTLAEIEFLD